MITHRVSLQGTIKAEAHVWGESDAALSLALNGKDVASVTKVAFAVDHAVLLLQLHQDPLGRHASAASSSLSVPRLLPEDLWRLGRWVAWRQD